MLQKVCVLFAIFTSIHGAMPDESVNQLPNILSSLTSTTSSSSPTSWFGAEFGVLQKVYDDCQSKNDFTGCLKGKALVALTKAVDQDSISIMDGVYLEKQNQTSIENTPSITSARALNDLSGIDKQLLQKLDSFLRTHVVKMDMSEGRDKDKKEEKKLHKYALAAFLTAMGIAGPLGLKAIATIAGKALVISKVALTIAGIIALKKIFSHDHHEEKSFHVHTDDGHNRRNMYIVRPVKSSMGNVGSSGSVIGTGSGTGTLSSDPYNYYHNHHNQHDRYTNDRYIN